MVRKAAEGRTTRRSSSSSKAKTSSNNGRRKESPAVTDTVTAGDYWHAFTGTRAFIPIITILATLVIVGIDLLISWNGFNLFFKLLGVQILIVFAVWIIRILVSLGNDKSDR